MTPPDLALARLLQLASPALPVGAYSYSQGLESAVEERMVVDAETAERWIGDLLRLGTARLEAPLWCRLASAWEQHDLANVQEWNDFFLATRETAELRAETLQMGYSLARLLADIGEFESAALDSLAQVVHITFPAAFTFAATEWHIPAQSALIAYLWSWLENQVMAAVKCVPLGQTDGQRLLARLGAHLPTLAQQILTAGDDLLCNFTPALAIASSRHETQYSRLFRS
jgi:urease accessory protein